jgi:hypothetical protein
MDSSVLNIIIFNRKLGSTDESSTDEEQGEKILFFYPQSTSLYWQVLNAINMQSQS